MDNNQRSPLSAIKIVECGEGVSAAFGAKLLADVGAQVIKIEPPAGDLSRRRGPFPGGTADPEKSGLFISLNANKRSVVADLRRPEGRERLAHLLADADVLIHNVPPPERAEYGLDGAALCARFPKLIVTSISTFGDYGPYSNWKGYELNVVNGGGWAYLSPGASPDNDLPPLKCFGHQGDLQGGAHAAFVTLAAYIHQLNSGAGQAIDVSEQECIAALLENHSTVYAYTGREDTRLGQRLLGPWGIMDSSDGPIFVCTIEEDQWRRLVEFMGNPEWASEEPFKDRFVRGQNIDAVRMLMADWLNQWKVQDLYREAQNRRIPFAPVNRMQDLYENEHLRERNFFVSLEQPGLGTMKLPGAPSRYGRTPWALRRPAPRLGEHSDEVFSRNPWDGPQAASAPTVGKPPSVKAKAPELPLAGIRVLDFTWAWAGPFCTLQLAHLGAEVIRVETAVRTACISRSVPPYLDDIPGPNRAGYFNQYNQGKKGITLDLTKPEGIGIAHALARHADVVADNFAAGVMDKLGLGYEKLRAIKPDLIMISMSGYGQTGPFKRFIGYGPPANALAGMFWTSGYSGRGPSEIGISYPDPNAGVFGALAVMSALTHRRLTGEGQFIDQSQWEAALVLMPEGLLEYELNRLEPVRDGNHDRYMSPHECYKAAGDDNKWVSIAVGSEQEWRALCRVMGNPGLADDPRFKTAALRKQNEAALDQIVTAWTKDRDRWETTRLLQAAGVAAFPSMSDKDLSLDPHLRERGYLVQLEHPEVGKRIHNGIPWKMSATPCTVRKAAPLRGADTDGVLRSVLNYTDGQIEDLRKRGILS